MNGIRNGRLQHYKNMQKLQKLGKPMKKLTSKRLDALIKHQQMMEEAKTYSPGLVEFENTQACQSRIVNFFGDVHTEVFSVRVNVNDDKSVAVGCANGQVKVYDLIEGKVQRIGYTSRMAGYPCTSVKWKPLTKTDYVACNCDGTIKWYTQNHEAAYGHYEAKQKSYLCGDYQMKEQWCVFGTDLNTIEVFDNQTMKPIHEYESGGPEELSSSHHTNRIFSVKCMPTDKNIFFSGGWDETVHVWDVRVGSGSVRKFPGPSISADSLDYKNGVLLAGNYQNNDMIQLYDFGSGKLLQTLDVGLPANSNSYCFTAAFAQRSEHNLIAAGLSGSNSVKLFLNNKLACTMKFQAAPLSLDFYRLHHKDYLVVGGLQGTIYAIRMKIEE